MMGVYSVFGRYKEAPHNMLAMNKKLHRWRKKGLYRQEASVVRGLCHLGERSAHLVLSHLGWFLWGGNWKRLRHMLLGCDTLPMDRTVQGNPKVKTWQRVQVEKGEP